jgi:predicted metal-dependent peptidase
MGAGMYMPSAISERVDELVVAVDTSGSIGDRELNVFLSEVKGICDMVKPERVRLLYWGCSVVADETYEHDELDTLVNSTKPRGGGGTLVECVPEYMAQKGINPQACIVLTDGYLGGSWGRWLQPVLWAIMDNKSAVPNVGKAVHIKSTDLTNG